MSVNKVNAVVIGLGFVGGALFDSLESNEECVVYGYDPYTTTRAGHNVLHNNPEPVLSKADLVFVCVPTNLNEQGKLDNTQLYQALELANEHTSSAIVVIRSTMGIGWGKELKQRYPSLRIVYVPEFLRERSAKEDILQTDRLVIAGNLRHEEADLLIRLLAPIKLFSSTVHLLDDIDEAILVKLFTNLYLAQRVNFFNALQTACSSGGVDFNNVVSALGSDVRIGSLYNRSSFGFGGSCLPKDVTELAQHGHQTVQQLASFVLDFNDAVLRKHLAAICSPEIETVGFYGLTDAEGSENTTNSITRKMMLYIEQHHPEKTVLYYEPCGRNLANVPMVPSLHELLSGSDCVVVPFSDLTFAFTLMDYRRQNKTDRPVIYRPC